MLVVLHIFAGTISDAIHQAQTHQGSPFGISLSLCYTTRIVPQSLRKKSRASSLYCHVFYGIVSLI
jgi:hypothetical protein